MLKIMMHSTHFPEGCIDKRLPVAKEKAELTVLKF